MADPVAASKLRVDRFSDGGVTCLKLAGIIDEQFDGKGLAAQVRGGVLVLDLADIERISSFGIREWVDFVAAAGKRVSSLWFVECAPKVVDQFNMVANFGGAGHLVSFYAPYRCDYCDDDRRRLVRVADEMEALRTGKMPERSCASCGNAEYFDEDPLTFFSYVQGHAPAALPPEVEAFLADRLHYAPADGARKLRIEKQIDGRATYLKLSGDLDGSFPTDKLAEGLEGDVIFDLSGIGRIDPAGASEWRQLMARVAAPVDRLLLCGCPAAFVERLTRAEDLAGKGIVVTLQIPYACPQCRSTTAKELDASEHHALFAAGKTPALRCSDCNGALNAVGSEALIAHLPSLPRPDIAPELRAQVERFRAEAQRLALAQKSPAPQQLPSLPSGSPSGPAPRGISWSTVLAAVGVIVALGIGFLAVQWLRHKNAGAMTRLESSHPAKPEWVDQTFFRDGDRLFFVGRSSLVPDKADGFEQADEAALEEIAQQLALSARDPAFIDHVRSQFEPFRQKTLGDLERATVSGEPTELERARRAARIGRHRVAESLRKTATGLPPERAEIYWEKLQTPDGARYQVFSRWAVGKQVFEKMLEAYLAGEEAMGARAVTYFPSLAWRHDVVEGAVVAKLTADSALRFAGVQEGDIVLTGMDRVVHDARAFKRVMNEEAAALAQQENGGALVIKVKRGDAPAVETRIKIAASARPKIAKPTSGTPKTGTPTKTGRNQTGNIWDDNPDE
jgi:anti-anti-sigma regulatory factor